MPRARVALLALVLGMPLAGCSGGVEVSVPSQAGRCGRPSWPVSVGRAQRRETTPADPAVAAWGDPAIIGRCGQPEAAPTTDTCVTVDGVDWVARPLSDGTALTSYGTDPAVEVLVPASYGPAPLLLPAFTPVAKALPATGHHCS